MNTQACARTRANTPVHVCMRYAQHAGTCMHASAQCTCMHKHAHARTHLHMRTHSCKHTPTYLAARQQIGAILLSCELCLGRPYLSLAVWPCLSCTRMATPQAATLVVEAEWLRRPVSVGMVAQLEASCWACHAMHKVVALASSLQQPLASWRISAV